MKRLSIFLFSLFFVIPAFAGDIAELSVSMFGGSSVGFGSLTPSSWRLHEGRGADARLTVFLPGSFSAAVDLGRQRIVSRDGTVIESSHAVPEALMLDWYGPSHGRAIPYLGVGASYLRYRQAHSTSAGQLAQPDHAALMTEAGVRYLLSPHWRLNTGVRFGPARSTAEITHANGTVDKIDFHQLYMSCGIGFSF